MTDGKVDFSDKFTDKLKEVVEVAHEYAYYFRAAGGIKEWEGLTSFQRWYMIENYLAHDFATEKAGFYGLGVRYQERVVKNFPEYLPTVNYHLT
eukprot:SAG31_NODE_4926_length_2859_cov_110.767029_3_plen_94_part_00